MSKIFVKCLVVLLIMGIMAGDALAVCNGAFVNPLTETSWSCMFPIRLAGVRISPSGPEPESHISTPLCSCQDGEFTRVGLVMEFSEPALMLDVVLTDGIVGLDDLCRAFGLGQRLDAVIGGGCRLCLGRRGLGGMGRVTAAQGVLFARPVAGGARRSRKTHTRLWSGRRATK